MTDAAAPTSLADLAGCECVVLTSRRGRPRGAPVDGTALVVGEEHLPRVTAALLRRCGWKLRVAQLLTSLSRSSGARVGIIVRDA